MKAILVIDMPKNCAKCKLRYLQGIGESICNAVDWEERPSWCPLRPLPTKKEHSGEDNPYSDNYEDEYEYQYREGYNICLREITGETE